MRNSWLFSLCDVAVIGVAPAARPAGHPRVPPGSRGPREQDSCQPAAGHRDRQPRFDDYGHHYGGRTAPPSTEKRSLPGASVDFSTFLRHSAPLRQRWRSQNECQSAADHCPKAPFIPLRHAATLRRQGRYTSISPRRPRGSDVTSAPRSKSPRSRPTWPPATPTPRNASSLTAE